jgi:hypothetical protein
MKNYREHIFRSIGNLLYAISRPHKPSLIARGEIRMLLGEIWFADVNYGPTNKAMRAPKVISLTIDTLANQNVSADEAFENFENFYASYPHLFSSVIKEKVMETAQAILNIISPGKGPNKYMEALKLLFQRKPKEVVSRRSPFAVPV